MKKKIILIILMILCLSGIGVGTFNLVENNIIIKEYGKLDDGVFNENDPQKITKKLGRYNGYVVVFFYKEIDRTNLHRLEDTNSINFYTANKQFYLYKNRNFYTLRELEENHEISSRESLLIHCRFDNYRYNQFVLYGKEM